MSIDSISTGQAPPGAPLPAAPVARGVALSRAAPSANVSPTPTPAALAPAQPDAATAKTPTKEQVDQALQDVRDAVKPMAQDLQFEIDSDTGKTVVKIIDAATKDVIRQFPSEELLAIAKGLEKFEKLQGMLLQQKA